MPVWPSQNEGFTTNVRLKDTVNQLRSSRNFCIDIILLCIILGIAAYIYKGSKCKHWRNEYCKRLVGDDGDYRE
ncbi:hypothetical protein CsSME_00038388 [Camellia sinensis var. sinensis]